MKRFNAKQRFRHTKLSRRRHVRALRRRYGLRQQTETISASTVRIRQMRKRYPQLTLYYRRGKFALEAPKRMRLGGENDEAIQFLQCMRSMTALKARQVSVDFSTIQDISPLCAMLLASEVHRWQLITKKKLRVIKSELWAPTVRQLLHDIGLFDLVSVQNPLSLDPVNTEERFIRIRSATLVDLEVAIAQIEHEVGKIAILLNSNPTVYGGIEEAI